MDSKPGALVISRMMAVFSGVMWWIYRPTLVTQSMFVLLQSIIRTSMRSQYCHIIQLQYCLFPQSSKNNFKKNGETTIMKDAQVLTLLVIMMVTWKPFSLSAMYSTRRIMQPASRTCHQDYSFLSSMLLVIMMMIVMTIILIWLIWSWKSSYLSSY